MATTPYDLIDNAIVQVKVSGDLNNTTNPITLTLTTGDEAKFVHPVVGNSPVTIWDKTTYADPKDDPQLEEATITAVDTTLHTITLSRPSAKTHAASPFIGELWRTTFYSQLWTAINALENAPASLPRVYDAVVASSGGDYTTVSAALAAGKRTIFVRNGTYTEGILNTAWTGTIPITIVGESRDKAILQFANASTAYFNLNIAGSSLQKLTLKAGSTQALAGAGAAASGWIDVSSDTCFIQGCKFIGNSAGAAGFCLNLNSTTGAIITDSIFQNCPSTGVVGSSSPRGVLVCNNYFTSNTTGAVFDSSAGSLQFCSFINNQGDHSGTSIVSLNIGGATANRMVNIVGNNIKAQGTANGWAAYSVGGDASTTNATGINICNNVIFGSNTGGIYATACNGATISGNSLFFNGTATTFPSQYGIATDSGQGTVVTGNNIVYSGGAQTGMQGMNLGSNGDIIKGNFVTGYSSTSQAGINAHGAGNIVDGNSLYSCTIGVQTSGSFDRLGINFFSSCTSNYSVATSTQSAQLTGHLAVSASTATTTVDMKQYSGFIVTLSSNTTFAFTDETLSGKPNGLEYTFEILQNATGGFTVAWPANVVWPGATAPTITTTASKRDFIKLRYDQAAQKYYGWVVGQNY